LPLDRAGSIGNIDFTLAEFRKAAAGTGDTNAYVDGSFLLFPETLRYRFRDWMHRAGAINFYDGLSGGNAGRGASAGYS
jgi:hypothetical protein